ncbi:MAG: hypothetical protein RR057_07255, partial [Clostridia bacterium]
ARIFKQNPPIPPKYPALCKKFLDFSFVANDEFSPSTGLFPILLQAVTNNYTKGLSNILFETKNDEFMAIYREKDEEYRFLVGFNAPIFSELTFHGEPYRVAVTGKTAFDEDGFAVMKIKVAFLETPSERILKIHLNGSKSFLEQFESPGQEFAKKGLKNLINSYAEKPILGSAIEKLNKGYLDYKVEKIFSPVIHLNAIQKN